MHFLGVIMSTALSLSVNVSDFYSPEFSYPLPRNDLESYFDGKAFDHKASYTPEEREALLQDIQAIWQAQIFQAKKGAEIPVVTLTAGAPGAGKTRLMESLSDGSSFYIDPDAVCLKQMEHTYKLDLEKALEGISDLDAIRQIRQDHYTKWRPASNAAAQIILANLLKEKANIFFGTTASGPFTWKALEFYKKLGYRVEVIHVTAPDDVRWGSIQERDKVFVQTTEKDTIEKGNLVPQRILDTYLRFADQIKFYFRAEVSKSATLAATWERREAEKPLLTICDRDSYQQIGKIHDAVCNRLNRQELLWNSSVEASSEVVD
jgi:dephospho-CoA kinase